MTDGPSDGEVPAPAAIQEASTCLISGMRRVLSAAQLFSLSESEKKRAYVYSASIELNNFWPLCSHEFKKSGILEEVGLPDLWIQCINDYDAESVEHDQLYAEADAGLHGPKGANCFFAANDTLMLLLYYGLISVAAEHGLKICKMAKKHKIGEDQTGGKFNQLVVFWFWQFLWLLSIGSLDRVPG